MAGVAQHSSYDEVPYPDLCYAYTHPGRVAAIASLLNVQPAPVETCRVLELGCAGGGNLLPMACGIPNGTFVGLDISARQIEAAQHAAQVLNLHNITFHQMDILDVTPDLGEFDYIIVHGIYSWVPPEVRDKLLSICKANLAPQGVAYISYNTLPGWHMVLMIREMMLYHTRDVDDPYERAQQSRALIRNLVEMIPGADQSAYASFLTTYTDLRFNKLGGYSLWEDSAILHDELSEVNEPVYFHQFVEHAAQHGLQFLAEADFPQVMMHDLSEDAKSKLQHVVKDVIELQQYLDFIRHQTFRRTLLCHDSIEIDHTLRADRVRHLYVATRAQLVSDEDGNEYFRTFDDSTFPADPPITRAALLYLGEISPRAVAFSQLFEKACARAGIDQPSEEDARMLGITLLQGFSFTQQLAEFFAFDHEFALSVSEYPQASPLTLYQVQNAPLVSNLRHEQVELEGLPYVLLPYLDGKHDRAALVDTLIAQVESGQLAPPKDGIPLEQIREKLTQDVEFALRWLAKAALLIA